MSVKSYDMLICKNFETAILHLKDIENPWFYLMHCDKRISIRYTVG